MISNQSTGEETLCGCGGNVNGYIRVQEGTGERGSSQAESREEGEGMDPWADLMIDVGDVDRPADHLIALRLAGAAVDPPLAAVGVAAAVPSKLLLRAGRSRSDENRRQK